MWIIAGITVIIFLSTTIYAIITKNSYEIKALDKENVNIICKTNINNDKINCGSIVKEICLKCEGNGGGNKTFAQGGGSNAKNIITYLKELKNELKELTK